jgi:DNA repair protein RecO (recombination protein O)
VELCTAEFGRIAAVARGAKSAKSKWRGLLQSGEILWLELAGEGDLRRLQSAELTADAERAGPQVRTGAAYLQLLHVLEVLLKLLPRPGAAEPALFAATVATLRALGSHGNPLALRHFEWQLLAACGQALPLARLLATCSQPLDEVFASFSAERGLRLTDPNEGCSLAALQRCSSGIATASDERALKRVLLPAMQELLGGQRLSSHAWLAARTGK